MSQSPTLVPGVFVNSIHERMEFAFDTVSNPNLSDGDVIHVQGKDWIVYELKKNLTQTRTTVKAISVDASPAEVPIRSNVRANRKAVALMREMLAEKCPDAEFGDSFIFHLISLTRHLGITAAAKAMSEKLAELGIADERLSVLAEEASQELSRRMVETFRLWPGVLEGKPVLPRADK